MRAQRQRAGRSTRLVCVLWAILALAALPCFSGCGDKSAADAKKELEQHKKKEKPKPPFEPLKVFTEPNERSFTDPKDLESQTPARNAIKPGHWTGVLVEAKVNNFDFGGDMLSEPRDNQQSLVDLEGSPFGLVMSRPAALAKGQKKTLEAIFYASPLGGTIQKSDVADSNFYVEQPGGDQQHLDVQPVAQSSAGHRVAGRYRTAVAYAELSILHGGARARSRPLSLFESARQRAAARRIREFD